MSDDSIEFASLLCSRLCHDLLSPVGSFGNGLELLADEQEPEMQERCIALLQSSADTAINRLKFFRLAFGSAGGYGQTLAVADLVEALQGQVAAGRDLTIAWAGGPDPIDKLAGRIILLLGLSMVDALVRGGRLDVAVEQRSDALEVALRAVGPRVVIDEASVSAFADADQPPTPKTIGIHLARRLARRKSGEIMMSRPAEGEIVVGAVLPGL